MDRTSRRIILGNAIIWAAVLLGCAVILQGTDYFGQVLPVLAGGAGGSIAIVVGGVKRRAG